LKRHALIIPPEELAAEREKLADEARVEDPVGEQRNTPEMLAPTSTSPQYLVPHSTLNEKTPDVPTMATLPVRTYSPETVPGLSRSQSRSRSPSPHLLSLPMLSTTIHPPSPKQLSPKRLAPGKLAPPCQSLGPRRSTSESRQTSPRRPTAARPRAELPPHLSTAMRNPERFVHGRKEAPSGVRQVDPSTMLSRAASPIPRLRGPERYSPALRRIATEPHGGCGTP